MHLGFEDFILQQNSSKYRLKPTKYGLQVAGIAISVGVSALYSL